MAEPLDVEINAGDPISADGYTLTPFAQSIKVTLPGFPGGFIWNRPVSILVENPDGNEQVIPIQDVTRQVVFGLIGVSLGIVMISWLISKMFRK